MTIERILGTDTGKAAFDKADRNAAAFETQINNLNNKVIITTLPFESGFADEVSFGQRSYYSKNFEGKVRVNAICKFTNIQKIDWGTGKKILTMPNGFAPTKYDTFFGKVLLNGNTGQTQDISVGISTTPGTINLTFFDYVGTNNILLFTIEYYA